MARMAHALSKRLRYAADNFDKEKFEEPIIMVTPTGDGSDFTASSRLQPFYQSYKRLIVRGLRHETITTYPR